MDELQLLRWKILDLLRWLMWDGAAPPWEEFQEEEDVKEKEEERVLGLCLS